MNVNGLEYKQAHARARGCVGFFVSKARPNKMERIKLELPTPRGRRVIDVGYVEEVSKMGFKWLVQAQLKPRLRGLML